MRAPKSASLLFALWSLLSAFNALAEQRSFYSPEQHLIAESTGSSSTIVQEYVWFGDVPVAQFDGATHSTRWTFDDHLGTPTLQTDADGMVAWRIESEPYGAGQLRAGDTLRQPLRFPGQESDGSANDRSYNIERWYRPGWGRYTQADPAGLSAGVNLFSYVDDAPVRYADPRGLIRRSKLDELSCCELLEAIQEAVKQLRRLLKNQMDPAKTRASSPFEYWDRYGGHLQKWSDYQRRLEQLVNEYDGRPCDPGLPETTRKWIQIPYPEFDWKTFGRKYVHNFGDDWDMIKDVFDHPPHGYPVPPVPPPYPIWVLQ